MVKRVNLDAMFQRADFAILNEEYKLDLFANFPMIFLEQSSSVRQLLRKPDFQRETNHWTSEQLVQFIESFLDNELIPSLILWKAPNYIFIIDGGHRLSTLRAWIEDDYGDGHISREFYQGEISDEQKRIAKRTRALVEKRVGRFSHMKNVIGSGSHVEERVLARALSLQWVQGPAEVAETSFFKINSQGTPLDDVEELLLRNRRKPIAIAARAIVRAGSGHKYWSDFEAGIQVQIEEHAKKLFDLLFEPETEQPVKTLDLPLGGSVSPVDAL